jgi:hypothetical protein
MRPPTFVALLDLSEKLHIDPADDRGSTPMAGKDDAFLPELVEKGGTHVVQEVVPMSIKMGVSVDLYRVADADKRYFDKTAAF